MNSMSYKGYSARIDYDDEDGLFVGPGLGGLFGTDHMAAEVLQRGGVIRRTGVAQPNVADPQH